VQLLGRDQSKQPRGIDPTRTSPIRMCITCRRVSSPVQSSPVQFNLSRIAKPSLYCAISYHLMQARPTEKGIRKKTNGNALAPHGTPQKRRNDLRHLAQKYLPIFRFDFHRVLNLDVLFFFFFFLKNPGRCTVLCTHARRDVI
jgi:hypothetical protein